jgi:two-component system NtrC family sensor kinase
LEFVLEDLPKLVSSMRVGAERIQKIVSSLRTFSRMDEADFKAVDIHEGIDSTLMILQSQLKERSDRPEIRIIKDYGNLPQVECYAGQLNQVFMNLFSNAIDAINERLASGIADLAIDPAESPACTLPTITIRTELTRSNQVSICIADNGMGMSEAIRNRLFDPFFTTKPVGKGTGMGLSISYQIVTDRHQGTLHCNSSPGKGSEFVIEIPVKQEALQLS